MEERIIIERKSNQVSLVTFIVISVLSLLASLLYFVDAMPTHALVCLIIGGVFALFSIVSAFLSSVIVLTSKRITGSAPFGSQINLPLDSVSAIATFNHFIFFRGIVVGTPAGKIKFYRIAGATEVFEGIRKQLIANQNGANADEDEYDYEYDYYDYYNYYYYPRRRKPIDFSTYRNGKPVKPRFVKPRVPRYR